MPNRNPPRTYFSITTEASMRQAGLYVTLVLTLAPRFAGLAVAQTTTTNCNGSRNYLTCTSNTAPSQQQQFQQSLLQLSAVIAQRNAAAAAQQAAWDAAATDEARGAATVARANYEATTAALRRFLADTTTDTTLPLNADLVVDWSLLNGLEGRYEMRGEGKVRWEALVGSAWTDTPEGNKVLLLEESDKALVKGEVMTTLTTLTRFDPATGFLLTTTEGSPRYQTVPPAYESVVRVGRHAFSTRMQGQGYDVTVAPGVLTKELLWLAVAAMPADLPPAFRIWVVDERGEVVPADFRVTGRTTMEVPLARAGESCTKGAGLKKEMDAVTLSVSIGATVQTVNVLATAPHLAERSDLKCRIIER
jgi:hypothetical protein